MQEKKFRQSPRYSHRALPDDIKDRLRGRRQHLSGYLVHLLPRREDYMPAGGAMPKQMHSTERDQGRYLHTDSLGKVELTHQFLDYLDENPVSWREFERAIAELEQFEHTNPPGRVMVAVLRFYQGRRLSRARGVKADDFADSIGTNPRNLARIFDSCVDHLGDMVLRSRGA